MKNSVIERTRGAEIAVLFLTFLRIGAFTFGGGYGMLRLLEDECIEKQRWLDRKEFLNMVAMAESTPGPVAINSATYIGYRRAGIFGAAAATIAVCLPSFVLLYLISLYWDRFISFALIEKAFRGIQSCVVYLIFSAGWKMVRNLRKNKFDRIIFLSVLSVMTVLTLCSVSISSIHCIIVCGVAGVIAGRITEKRGGK